MKEELKNKCYGISSDVIIPVHGPKVTSDSIVQLLKSSVGNKDTNQAIIFHIDISPNVSINKIIMYNVLNFIFLFLFNVCRC